MMVWKLATRPVTAISASKDAPVPAPKIVWKPRKRGSADVDTSFAPGAIPELKNNVRKAAAISVMSP